MNSEIPPPEDNRAAGRHSISFNSTAIGEKQSAAAQFKQLNEHEKALTLWHRSLFASAAEQRRG
jgi:hypothetical protein